MQSWCSGWVVVCALGLTLLCVFNIFPTCFTYSSDCDLQPNLMSIESCLCIQQDTVEKLIIQLKEGNLITRWFPYLLFPLHLNIVFHWSAIHSCSLKVFMCIFHKLLYIKCVFWIYVHMSYVHIPFRCHVCTYEYLPITNILLNILRIC